jgi:hypothetical protein
LLSFRFSACDLIPIVRRLLFRGSVARLGSVAASAKFASVWDG